MKVKPYFTFVLALFAAACHSTAPAPVKAPPTDAADALPPPEPLGDTGAPTALADCEAACLEIDKVGCVTETDCAAVLCAANNDPRFTHYDVSCLIHAMLPSDIAVCGVDCTLKTPSSLAHPL
jgi:hypothetical protein